MKLEVEQLELSTIVASLGKSRHYFEYVEKTKGQQIRLISKTKTDKTRRKRRCVQGLSCTSEIVCKVIERWIVDYENLGSRFSFLFVFINSGKYLLFVMILSYFSIVRSFKIN